MSLHTHKQSRHFSAKVQAIGAVPLNIASRKLNLTKMRFTLSLCLLTSYLIFASLSYANIAQQSALEERAVAVGVAQTSLNISEPQLEQKKVALIIGNSEYKVGPLTNPVNDATSMSKMLTNLGFEVITALDLDKANMDKIVNRFVQELETADVGLFFFAGHGVQVQGANYLIPINAQLHSQNQIPKVSLSANDLMLKMEASKVKTSIIILDACRNNPFAPASRSMGTTNGLARMDAPTGSIVIYATAPGKTASDGRGDNGLFTGHLLDNMSVPGRSIFDIAIATRRAVMTASKGKQVPWELSSLTQQFYFQANTSQAQLVALNNQVATQAPDNGKRPLVINTLPANATITLLKSAIAYSPGVELPVKKYQVKIQAPGYESLVRSIDLARSSAYEFSLGPTLNNQKYTVDEVSFEMIAIPGGEFVMGCKRGSKECPDKSNNPQNLTISGFRLMQTETTMALYKLCVKDGTCSDTAFERLQYSPQMPVSSISYYDIKEAFIPWLEYRTNSRFRLPTEAEWEYAYNAKSGNLGLARNKKACKFARIQAAFDSGCSTENKPANVKSFKANAYGLFDMLGNVAELVEGCYSDSLSAIPLDGTAQSGGDCKFRVYRGGSYADTRLLANPLERPEIDVEARSSRVGFRLAQSADMLQ